MVFHVLNRANARAHIFPKDEDDASFERMMTETLEKKPMRILGYLMMPDALASGPVAGARWRIGQSSGRDNGRGR